MRSTRSRASSCGRTLLRHERLANLLKPFFAQYAEPTELLVYDRNRLVQKALSTQGVRQGDPFAALAFALTVQPLYEAALVEAAAGEADGVNIHDDFNVVGSLDQVLRVFRYVQAHSLADFGLELHVDKCQVYIPPETCDALSAEELKAMRHRSAFRRTRSRTAWIRWE